MTCQERLLRTGAYCLLVVSLLTACRMPMSRQRAEAFLGPKPRALRSKRLVEGDLARPGDRPALRSEEVAAALLQAAFVVDVDLGDGSGASGSAFAVLPNLLLTNEHVVRGAKSLEVYPVAFRERRLKGECIGMDRERDLALIRVPGLESAALPLAEVRPALGTQVYMMGNPTGLEGTFSQGVVSGHRFDGDVHWMQVSAPTSSGSSGSAVVDGRGVVVGVHSHSRVTGEAIKFAAPVDEILRFCKRYRVVHAQPTEAIEGS